MVIRKLNHCPQCDSDDRSHRGTVIDSGIKVCDNDWHQRPGMSSVLLVLAGLLVLTLIFNV